MSIVKSEHIPEEGSLLVRIAADVLDKTTVFYLVMGDGSVVNQVRMKAGDNLTMNFINMTRLELAEWVNEDMSFATVTELRSLTVLQCTRKPRPGFLPAYNRKPTFQKCRIVGTNQANTIHT